MPKAVSIPTIIIAIVVIGGLVFIGPLITMAQRVDNITQQNVKLIIQEYVNEIANTGKVTTEEYQALKNRLAATGNKYDVEIEVHHLDENPGKKTSQAQYTKIGENVYYIEFTTQVLKQLGIKSDDENVSNNNEILLKSGDMIYVSAKSVNSTTAQTQQSTFFQYSNSGEHAITASSSAMVMVNGK